MKTRLLAGFTALVLGGLTSCSNILEENGVINNVAESGMGELRINLSTDGALNVNTKAQESVTTNKTTVEINGKYIAFDPNLLMITATEIATTSNPNPTKYISKFTEFPSLVKATTYSVSAIYDKMGEKVLAWDAPSFAGATEKDVIVSTTVPGTASINAKLDNSIITIEPTSFETFKGQVSIQKLFVYAGDTKPTDDNGISSFSLINGTGSSATLKTDQLLFVKKGATNINIFIEYLLQGERKDYTKLIKNNDNTDITNGKDYKIKYDLVTKSGKLALQITVDGKADTESIDVPVDPYNPAN